MSSGESEYYGLTKGAALGLGLQAILEDWGVKVTLVVASDSSAAKGFASRRGLGRQRHIQTKFLRLQERLAAGHLEIFKIPGAENRSDILTKIVAEKLLQRHLKSMGQEFREGRSRQQKKLLTG